eukprot:GFKZ01000337.1.p1 GENE.GFKZ01000337.1~~GFKZ01000337.1.p1  ORF type:complete len:459 (-),score=44.52 GFKZ01000337.1:1232-2515(-)
MDEVSEAVKRMGVVKSGKLWTIENSGKEGWKTSKRGLYTFILRNCGVLQCDGLGIDYNIRGSSVKVDQDKSARVIHITPAGNDSGFSIGARDDVDFEAWTKALREVSVSEMSDSYVVENRPTVAKGASCWVFAGKRQRDGRSIVAKAISRKGKTKVAVLAETTVSSKLKVTTGNSQYPEGLVRIFEVYYTANEAHVVMERICGRSLEDWLQEHGPMSNSVARNVFMQIFKAVAFLHRNGILHGAVTTSNVLFVDNHQMRVKLIGFNTASWKDGSRYFPSRRLSEYQRCLKKDGLEYIAPEIWRGEAADTPADFWSLGCTLYKMLLGNLPFSVTSRKPWRGEAEGETMQKYASLKRADLLRAALFPSNCKNVTTISENATLMLFQLMRPDPQQRMGHSNAERHPWLKVPSQPPSEGNSRLMSPADYFD